MCNERDLGFLKHGSLLTLTHRASREKAVKEHRSPSCSSNTASDSVSLCLITSDGGVLYTLLSCYTFDRRDQLRFLNL